VNCRGDSGPSSIEGSPRVRERRESGGLARERRESGGLEGGKARERRVSGRSLLRGASSTSVNIR
jgi:hypothetical protein